MRLINGFTYYYTFFQKTSSKLVFVFAVVVSWLARVATLSRCRFAGTLEGTRFQLWARLLLQLPTTMEGGASSRFYSWNLLECFCDYVLSLLATY